MRKDQFVKKWIGSLSSSWTPQNFKPTSSASDNVAAWNAMPDGKIVNITTPGVYEINGTLYLPSNSKITFCAGCTIKKTGNFSQVFANKAIQSFTGDNRTMGSDTNIKFYGNGLRIMVNGVVNSTPKDTIRMYAQFNLYRVSNFIIDGFYMNDAVAGQMGLMPCSCTDGVISNISITGTGNGDQFKLAACKRITLNDIVTSGFDNQVDIVGIDWAYGIPELGDCEDITVNRWTSSYDPSDTPGAVAYTQTANWDNWQSGKTYIASCPVLNNGRLYMVNDPYMTGKVAANAPTHVVGLVTGADGIPWMCMQETTINHVSIRNITFKDCVTTAKDIFLAIGYSYDTYDNATHDTAITDNVVIDNLTGNFAANTRFIINAEKVGTLTVKNTRLRPFVSGNDPTLIYGSYVYGSRKVSTAHLIFDNCDIDISDNTADNGLVSVSGNVLETFGVLDIINGSKIKCRTAALGMCFAGQTNQFTEINIIDSELIDCRNIVYGHSTQNTDINLTRAKFTNTTSLLYANLSGQVYNIVSRESEYSEPSGTLFSTNSAAESISLDMTGSKGVISAIGKVYYDNGGVTVVNCDLPIPLLSSAYINFYHDADKIILEFASAMDATSVPAVTCFTPSGGKTVTNVAISGTLVTLTVNSTYGNTDVVTVGYTQPATNRLRGANLGEIATFTGQAVSDNLQPSILTNTAKTVGYYDFRDATKVTKDGSNRLSQVNDLSGSGNHLLQAGADATKMIWSSNGATADGAAQFIKAANFTYAQPEFILLVVKQLSWNRWSIISDGATNDSADIYQEPSTPSISLYAGRDPANAGVSHTLNTWGIIRVLLSGTNSYIQLNAGNKVTGNAGTSAAGGISIGAKAGGTGFSNIIIAGAVYCKVNPTDAEIADLYAWIHNKYSDILP